MRQRRINSSSRVVIEVVGGKGQHERLIDKALIERNKLATKLDISPEDIEVWAVCDRDVMVRTLAVLESYAKKKGVRLAFSDPRFEIFLLQHLTASATNETGKGLEALITKELHKLGINTRYDKTNLVWLSKLLDNDPQRVELAIRNSRRINNPKNTPYTNLHILLLRLLEFEVGR